MNIHSGGHSRAPGATDGAVILCGEVCGHLGTTLGSLRVSQTPLTQTVSPRRDSVDEQGIVFSVPTGRNRVLSTIHRATTTTQERITGRLEKKARRASEVPL